MSYENTLLPAFPNPVAVPPLVPFGPPPGPQNSVTAATSVKDFDLLPRVKGLYRLLDLYSENATGGLVDKIIISQESLKSFLDTIHPGSYKSVTKIDFHALNLLSINAIGIYGSKTEIVRFLRNLDAIDGELEQLLLIPHDMTSTTHPHLRSGIYALIPPNSQGTDGSFNSHATIYIIYWPEETTWDDDAIGAVRKNRVTFMHYLTRLTDQVRALISPEHSSALAWEAERESNDDFDDRFFEFEVARTKEQEEAVAIREGFKVSHPEIAASIAPLFLSDGTSRSLGPILLHDETRPAFADRNYTPAQRREETIESQYSLLHLQATLREYDTIDLRDTVDHQGLEILLEDGGLKDRIPGLYWQYEDARREVESLQKRREIDGIRRGWDDIEANHMRLQSSVRAYVKSKVAENFPTLGFGNESTEPDPIQSLDTGADDYLHQLRDCIPTVDEAVNNALNDENSLEVIKSSHYKSMKGRFVLLESMCRQGQISEAERNEAIETLVLDFNQTLLSLKAFYTGLKSKFRSTNNDSATSLSTGQDEDDAAFIARMADPDPAYAQFASNVCNLARASLLKKMKSVTDSLVKTIESAQAQATKEESRRLSFAGASKDTKDLLAKYRPLIRDALFSRSTNHFQTRPGNIIDPPAGPIKVTIHREIQTEAGVQHRLWALETPEDDMLRLREDQKHQPKPRASNQPDKCICQLFAIDESFTSIQSRGSPFNLLPWYRDGIPNITSAAFFAGTEELCLVEEGGRVRVFSVPAQSFKPGTVRLDLPVCHVQSSPDGAALVAIEQDQDSRRLRVFHLASFGHKDTGISVTLPEDFNSATSFALTSIGDRRNVFLLALSPSLQCVHSVALDISRKEVDYQFRAETDEVQSIGSVRTAHNALIDCFSEVWSRYPVVAAIQREIFVGSRRLPPSITFVSEDPNRPFEPYVKQMITTFEKLTKKPTGEQLDKIVIQATRFEELEWEVPVSSTYKAGEWLAELLCLIPIHIALARDNCFVPLKDGILDPAHERQLLGAEITQIIDAITVGWYESIFSSYMATKPVKVVSSMGEQSVGKSYCLNHLVGSSFAGSAVRTTEGVWLSVCPTKDVLVVALDFEGVHSIERTAQEDMLLVLFNTALSNLVLFRNNFALSRDIANMFTSFQASTHLFDPASNPKLFKGLLAIVIKDVVDGDKKEIVREFRSKFSQIVSAEKADNFITVLHDSRLTVIPWNVIQSPEFYTLFSRLSKCLFDQRTTHASAREFLMTLKTLMAKLKAQDWSSIDQTVIKHRVAALTSILPNAFATGHEEIDLVVEDLKNLDDQEPVVDEDSEAVFYLGKEPHGIDRALSIHLQNWKPDASRHSVQELQEHLKDIADLRLAHVRVWLDVNTQRFPVDNADIRGLRRLFDDTSAALLSNIQLCLAECAEYVTWLSICAENYVPLKRRKAVRAGVRSPEITKTTKTTWNTFVQPEYTNAESCAVFETSLHQMVRLTLVTVCAPDHMMIHTTNIVARTRVPAPSSANCVNVTARLAITSMDSAAMRYIFLRQEHDCRQECELPGICYVDTTPKSVELRYTGMHDDFSYTKYTQVARRLHCAVRITAGEREHAGPHVHSTEVDPFHFCEQKCMNCGYFCQLPRGHPQAEHDTAHGSMERTSWAIEGAVDATVEVQGRKFGAQDNGAPQLCSSLCRNLGRHAHIDYCRNVGAEGRCQEPESEHIEERMLPNPDRPKDWVSHGIFWARTGFRGMVSAASSNGNQTCIPDPYSNAEQTKFALCDAQCPGPEHDATLNASARPSYCTLPIFHSPQPTDLRVAENASYVSSDGHSFNCPNPNNLRPTYHVIFVLDKSGSMGRQDTRPLPNQPVTQLITQNNDNRFGAVLSSLYGFWVSRGSHTTGGRKDAYSVITFDGSPK
ncbi:hypothetical protein FRB99_003127, partial [Tulasnella sp. 403]